ncbi:MAG TPA: cell division protein CrgA [Acidimicrobiales bacterium]|jgi:hypothetical protein
MTERGKSGRTTPKGTVTAKGSAKGSPRRVSTEPTGRYTPPAHHVPKVSPVWVPILMFACFGLGAAMIVLNYVNLLPASPTSWYLVGGLGLVTVGFATATRLH